MSVFSEPRLVEPDYYRLSPDWHTSYTIRGGHIIHKMRFRSMKTPLRIVALLWRHVISFGRRLMKNSLPNKNATNRLLCHNSMMLLLLDQIDISAATPC